MLDTWLAWARRSQIPAFVELYHRIKKHRAGIVASVTPGLSNGLTECVNTKLRLITRMALRVPLHRQPRRPLPPRPRRPLPTTTRLDMTHGSARRARLWDGLWDGRCRPRATWTS
jgi:hypothetical protein